jgi:nitrite reductase/ring-hydroxylating ferredoxin subunit
MNHPTPENPNNVTRRGFFQLTLGWLAGSFAVALSAAGAVRFLVPNVLFEPSQIFKAGRPDDFADGTVTFLEDERVFLVRQGNTYRCLSAICTHLGCTVNRADKGYHCPCHGSVFDEQGTVKGGPAPRGLAWFQVTLSKDNRLLVDKGRMVAADKYLVLATKT